VLHLSPAVFPAVNVCTGAAVDALLEAGWADCCILETFGAAAAMMTIIGLVHASAVRTGACAVGA